MSGIVCAVRGGPGSHYTRREGLAQSLKTGTPLYLLVVIPPQPYAPLHEGEQRAIRAELAWRELALARSNFAQMGSPDAQFNIQIRIGDLVETISEFATEVGADRLLLGAPRDAMDAALSKDELQAIARRLATELSIDVEVIRPAIGGS